MRNKIIVLKSDVLGLDYWILIQGLFKTQSSLKMVIWLISIQKCRRMEIRCHILVLLKWCWLSLRASPVKSACSMYQIFRYAAAKAFLLFPFIFRLRWYDHRWKRRWGSLPLSVHLRRQNIHIMYVCVSRPTLVCHQCRLLQVGELCHHL